MNDLAHHDELINQDKPKDPWLAVLLSKLFPGAGQIYGGVKARGLFFISLTIALYFAIILGVVGFFVTDDVQTARALILSVPAVMIILFAISIYTLFDAYNVAKRRNPAAAQTAPEYRKAWLAAFLSAFVSGIGQFYNRQFIKGIALLAAAIAIVLFEDAYKPLLIPGLLVYLFGIKDAFDSAEAQNGSNKRFFRQERPVVLFIVIMLCLQSIPLGMIIRETAIQAYRFPSGSMYPTLMIGDHIFVGKSRPLLGFPQRGDIVVFPSPEDPEKKFVKRVIGTGGDKIQIINGELYINEQLVPSKKLDPQEENEQLWMNPGGRPTVFEERIGNATYHVHYLVDRSTINEGPWLVPQDAVFVLGDNRNNSQDSRKWGAVQSSTIEGKALKIYWSWDRGAAQVRWDRIGMKIQ